MKKSELKEMLVDLFARNYELLSDNKAYAIISLCEEVGMLPPAESNPDDPGSYFYHYWEPEES